MEVYFQTIKDPEGLAAACRELSKSPMLGFDTETTELDPYKGDLRLVQFSNGSLTYVIDMLPFRSAEGGLRSAPALAPLRDLLANERIIKVAHNAKFDAKWVRHHLGAEINGMFDTYLASVIISAGEQDRRHSLADVAAFFTGIELDKTMQVSDWSLPELSNSQIEYAARDAAIMLQLHGQMAERLKNDELERVAELEFDCLMPVAEMELNGFYLDRGRWSEQIERASAEQARLSDELQQMLSAGVSQASLFGRSEINLDSQAQVRDALENLGIPLPETTRQWELQPLAEKYPVIGKLLEYRAAAKSLSSFGDNILEFIEPSTGRIHADFRQIGAPTGRFSCSNPNLQQIPQDPRYRRCFMAPEGRKLVIADYSQIELRILADFAQDPKLIEAFESGEDFHTAAASQLFGVSAEDITGEQRSFAKRLNFGIVYGIGASRFGSMTGLGESDAETMMRRYFGTFTRLDSYLKNAGTAVIEERKARTRSNRLLRLSFDENDRQQTGSARRYGVNMPIQGTSADILKRSLRLLHDKIAGTVSKLVNIVHDEVIVECPAGEAESVAELLDSSMTAAGRDFLEAVPVKVDVHVADEWTK